jgi:hypothetical protein
MSVIIMPSVVKLNVVATVWSILKTTNFDGKKTLWLHNCHSLFQLEQEMAEVKKDVIKQVPILLNLFFVNNGWIIKLQRLCLASFFLIGLIFARKARIHSSSWLYSQI